MGLPSTSEEKETVLGMARPCTYPEWLLLELPNGMWGALWAQGLETGHCTAIAEGRYRDGCAYRSREKNRVLAYMAQGKT